MSLNEQSPDTLRNEFASLQPKSVESLMGDARVHPRQVATGVTRGTWRISNSDGSYITIGVIPETNDEFGIAFFNAEGTLISKNLGVSQTIYSSTGNELVKIDDTGYLLSDEEDRRIKLGTAPDDNRVGLWMTKEGVDVIDELES